jgi:hypothetical protein
MKKLLLVLFISILFFQCENKKEVPLKVNKFSNLEKYIEKFIEKDIMFRMKLAEKGDTYYLFVNDNVSEKVSNPISDILDFQVTATKKFMKKITTGNMTVKEIKRNFKNYKDDLKNIGIDVSEKPYNENIGEMIILK